MADQQSWTPTNSRSRNSPVTKKPVDNVAYDRRWLCISRQFRELLCRCASALVIPIRNRVTSLNVRVSALDEAGIETPLSYRTLTSNDPAQLQAARSGVNSAGSDAQQQDAG